jgi:LytS/YehU family sensor histidine kinase
LIDGPVVGQIVRLVLLLGMAAYAYRKIGKGVALALMVASVVVGVLALVVFLQLGLNESVYAQTAKNASRTAYERLARPRQ